MRHLFENNVILHPVRGLRLAFRRWTIKRERQVAADWSAGPLPPALQRLSVGELLPWKGATFKVGKIVGGDFPMVILVPQGLTRGAKLRGLRNFRDVSRYTRDEKRAIAKAMREGAPR